MLPTRGAALAGACLILPLAIFVWLLLAPGTNLEIALPTEHFFVVSLISLLAALVSTLIARVALRLAQYHVLFVTLGFASLAGLFAVHALATPGILLPAGADLYGTSGSYALSSVAGHAVPGVPGARYGGTVVGLSAFLSLLVPSLLFASSTIPAALDVVRRLPFGAAGLTFALLALVAVYGVAAAAAPDLVGSVPLSGPPGSYVVAALSVALLVGAAWQQLRGYRAAALPTQGALAIAFLLLAQAQIVMAVSSFWTLSWWGYHLLMLAAVVIALTALFVELDRRRGLERYVPLELVERVVAGNVFCREGDRRTVSVLFADLRDSTAIAERLPPTAVVELLNDYVGALARCVFLSGGMLDKFLGDGLMAIFGVAPDQDPSHGAAPAARAAVEMRHAIDAVNARRAAAGGAPMRFGVGIHTGEVVLGEIGIPQRLDFTAVGDAVNTAARLCDLAKEYGVDVLLSSDAADRLNGAASGATNGAPYRLEQIGEAIVRGRTETVCLFTIR